MRFLVSFYRAANRLLVPERVITASKSYLSATSACHSCCADDCLRLKGVHSVETELPSSRNNVTYGSWKTSNNFKYLLLNFLSTVTLDNTCKSCGFA